MNNNLTELVIVLDKSGSMTSCATEMEQALVDLVKEQREKEGECLVTFVRFSGQADTVFERKPIAQVEDQDLKLEPRGSTALNDALGNTINLVGQSLAALDEAERPGLVIVVTVTDGGENASIEYTSEQVNKMVKTQTDDYSWQFVYLGANQDAFAVGNTYGFSESNIANYNVAKSAIMGRSVSNLVGSMRHMVASGCSVQEVAASCSFSDEDRQSMV